MIRIRPLGGLAELRSAVREILGVLADSALDEAGKAVAIEGIVTRDRAAIADNFEAEVQEQADNEQPALRRLFELVTATERWDAAGFRAAQNLDREVSAHRAVTEQWSKSAEALERDHVVVRDGGLREASLRAGNAVPGTDRMEDSMAAAADAALGAAAAQVGQGLMAALAGPAQQQTPWLAAASRVIGELWKLRALGGANEEQIRENRRLFAAYAESRRAQNDLERGRRAACVLYQDFMSIFYGYIGDTYVVPPNATPDTMIAKNQFVDGVIAAHKIMRQQSRLVPEDYHDIAADPDHPAWMPLARLAAAWIRRYRLVSEESTIPGVNGHFRRGQRVMLDYDGAVKVAEGAVAGLAHRRAGVYY